MSSYAQTNVLQDERFQLIMVTGDLTPEKILQTTPGGIEPVTKRTDTYVPTIRGDNGFIGKLLLYLRSRAVFIRNFKGLFGSAVSRFTLFAFGKKKNNQNDNSTTSSYACSISTETFTNRQNILYSSLLSAVNTVEKNRQYLVVCLRGYPNDVWTFQQT